MADSASCGDAASHIFVKNKGDDDSSKCVSCKDYEIQLKEVLNKLGLAHLIINLLQNELLILMTSKNADSNDFISTSKTSSTNHTWKINKQHNPGIRIPVIINGRITNTKNRNPTSAMKKSSYVAGSKCNNIHHKVRIIGDSHLRDTAARINQYLNTKLEVCSLIKPGAYTKQLVDSLKTDVECLGEKGVIVSNGGANNIDIVIK
jgi:hypothetical protein